VNIETTALQTLDTQGETEVPDEKQQSQGGCHTQLPQDVYYGEAIEFIGGVPIFAGGD